MDRDQLFAEHAKAMAFGEAERANELRHQIPTDELESHFVFVGAFFATAMAHKLGSEPAREDIERFVQEMQADYRSAQPPINPLVIEGCIRTLYGEDYLLDQVSVDEQLRAQWLSIRKIVDQSPEMTARIDEFLSDARKLAHYWENDPE